MPPAAPGLQQAFATLGLHGPADGDALTRAFRIAVKAARPDLPGGDADRFRRVIAAYRLIQDRGGARPILAASSQRPATAPVLAVSPLDVVRGGAREVRIDGRRLRVVVPPGLRTGDHLRLAGGGSDGADLYLPVLIRPGDGLSVLGDDLFMVQDASPRLIRDGGRLCIETYAGPRDAWVAPGLVEPVRLRLRGLGLPARGARPAGHLFVTLRAAPDLPSSAEDLLARFSAVWTPQPLAA